MSLYSCRPLALTRALLVGLCDQINERYKDILYQYMKELEHYHTLFNLNRDAPPTYKNHPPVAGAIAWARDLYLRAKKPILRFQVRHDSPWRA